MHTNLRLATILAVTFLGAISAQANAYSAAGANAYVQSKDYQGLLRYATAWSKGEPNNADAWSYLGVAYGIYLKQPDKAVGPMLQSLKLNPNQAPGWHALGITYLQLKQNANAVGAISRAIKLNPNQPNYYNNLAAAYAEMARWQDAFNTLNDEEPLAERLNNAGVWYKLGNGYARLEQAQPAVSAYQHAIKLNPNWAQAWTNLGSMLQWGGNVQGADNAYVQGSRLGDPLAAQDRARLQQALAAQAAAAKGSANYNAIDRIINQQAKQALEIQLHNEGTLNINDHLP
ncbi:MAG TPA: tetratricopeptide repeat protein [Terracidiphilus sp.]|jgi:tetratricopeptide (TPR) repeat protein|nr:tetratricopeptide repeat protein [Terracidiphilus sp.]